MAFSFRVTPTILVEAIAFAAIRGLIGGWFPARQAMRLTVVDALRNI
jgi:putative ABC transport system permease protein